MSNVYSNQSVHRLLLYLKNTNPKLSIISEGTLLNCDLDQLVSQLEDQEIASVNIIQENLQHSQSLFAEKILEVVQKPADEKILNVENIQISIVSQQLFASLFLMDQCGVTDAYLRNKDKHRQERFIKIMTNENLDIMLLKMRLNFRLPISVLTFGLKLIQNAQLFSQNSIYSMYCQSLAANNQLYQFFFGQLLTYLLIEVGDIKQQYHNYVSELKQLFQFDINSISDFSDEIKEVQIQKLNLQGSLLISHIFEQYRFTQDGFLQAFEELIVFHYVYMILFDSEQDLLISNSKSLILVNTLIEFLNKVMNYIKNQSEVIASFIINYLASYERIENVKQLKIICSLFAMIDTIDSNQFEFLRQYLRPFQLNYYQCFCINNINFQYALELLKMVFNIKQSMQLEKSEIKAKSWNQVLDIIIINALQVQLKQSQSNHQIQQEEIFENNYNSFIHILLTMFEEIKVQMQYFIPIISQYYVYDASIIEGVHMGNFSHDLNSQRIDIKKYIIPGSSCQQYSQNKADNLLPISPYAFISFTIIKFVQDLISQFLIVWEVRKGMFARISIENLKYIVLNIEQLVQCLHANFCQFYQQKYSCDDRILTSVFPNNIIQKITAPLINQCLTCEFDFLKLCLTKACKNQEVSRFDPFNNYDSLSQVFVFQSSSFADDFIELSNSVYREIVNLFNLTDQSLQKLMTGFKSILDTIEANLMIHNPGFTFKLSNIFSGQSTKNLNKRKNADKFLFINQYMMTNPCYTAFVETVKDAAQQSQNFRLEYFKISANALDINNSVFSQYLNIGNKIHSISDIFVCINQKKLILNGLEKLRQCFERLQEFMDTFSLQRSNATNQLTSNFRNEQLDFSIAKDTDHSITTPYFDQFQSTIHIIAQSQMDYLGKQIIIGLNPLIQQLYCPSPKSRSPWFFDQIQQIMTYTLTGLSPNFRKPMITCLSQTFAGIYRFILLDSGPRSRTITEFSSKIIAEDIGELKSFLESSNLTNDLCLQKWLNRKEIEVRYQQNECSKSSANNQQDLIKPDFALLNRKDIDQIFRRVDRALELHSLPSAELIAKVPQLDIQLLIQLQQDSDMNKLNGMEEYVRIINFRRYAEETTRKWMQDLKAHKI